MEEDTGEGGSSGPAPWASSQAQHGMDPAGTTATPPHALQPQLTAGDGSSRLGRR